MQDNAEGSASLFDSAVMKAAAAILGFAVACAIGVIVAYKSHFPGGYLVDHAAWGQFGDFFGGTLNPILAMLSLFAILGALIIQSRELSHSTSALKEQSAHLNVQAFENTFFSMVHLCNENVKTLDLEETEKKEDYSQGRDAIRILLRKLKNNYENTKKYHSVGRDEREIVAQAYKVFSADNDRFIAHYLGSLKSIIDFIDVRSPSDPLQYYSIVSAQLSANERLLLFYHSLNCVGPLELRNLNKYNFFRDIPKQSYFDAELHSSLIINNFN